MLKNGPFDGILGFSQVRTLLLQCYFSTFSVFCFSNFEKIRNVVSQGAILAAALPGMQAQVLKHKLILMLFTLSVLDFNKVDLPSLKIPLW